MTTIKIQCPCGLRYALDVSDENLSSPIRFVCSQCGADNSGAINEIVRQQFGSEENVPVCHKHKDQPTTSNCLVCKKPICPECMALFGHVCSAYCAGKAERAGVELPEYEFQKSAVERRFWQKVRKVVAVLLVLLAMLIAVAMWYNFAGSRPKAAFTMKFPEARDDGFCKFIAADQILMRHGNQLARYDVKRKKEVWSTHLIDPKVIQESAEKWVDAQQFHAENAKVRLAQLKARGLDTDHLKDDEPPKSEAEQLAEAREMIERILMSQIRFHIQDSDIWVGYTNRIAHIDWNTGAMEKEIPLSGELRRFGPQEGSLMALCDAPLGEKILTHVRLPTGEAQTAAVKPEPATNSTRMKTPEVDIPLRAMAVHIRPDFVDGGAERYVQSAVGTYLVNSGPNVAEVKVTMIEEKITQQRTLKEQTGKSVLDGDIKVTQSGELANEIFNGIQEQHTGGIRFVDESRYLVTIRRKLGAGTIPDWVGEVTGPPQLFSLKTVDVLAAGTTVIVLDKQNQRRWDSKVAYPISAAMTLGTGNWSGEDSNGFMPCVERGNTLFIFDQGVLAAFDIATGNVRWRLPSVGVSALKFDGEGMMYITTTSANQEQIKYRDQVDVTRKVVPMIVKVDPHNGKIIWRLNQTGQTCVFSGKYFYSYEAFAGGGRRFGKEVGAHVRIYRLHPRDGRVIWDHIEKEYPLSIDFRDNEIVALFPNEMKVLTFMGF